MSVTLQPVTGDNLFDCIHAMTSAEQWDAYLAFAEKVNAKWVASNIVSMAQAAVYPQLVPLAIYDGETMVGFLMYEPLSTAYPEAVPPETENNGYYVARLMVSHQHQGKGFGKAGMRAAIEHLKAKPDCEQIYTSVHHDNSIAASLYKSLGFEPTGEVDEGEIVLRLDVR